METRFVPSAFRRAEAVRGVGLGLTGILSLTSGVLLAMVMTAVYIAAGLVGEGPGGPLPALALALGAYAVLAPSLFDRLTRATTAQRTARWLVAVVAGYAVGWTALVQLVAGG